MPPNFAIRPKPAPHSCPFHAGLASIAKTAFSQSPSAIHSHASVISSHQPETLFKPSSMLLLRIIGFFVVSYSSIEENRSQRECGARTETNEKNERSRFERNADPGGMPAKKKAGWANAKRLAKSNICAGKPKSGRSEFAKNGMRTQCANHDGRNLRKTGMRCRKTRKSERAQQRKPNARIYRGKTQRKETKSRPTRGLGKRYETTPTPNAPILKNVNILRRTKSSVRAGKIQDRTEGE